MLSLFPSLFDYGAVALGGLRMVVAIIFILNGYKNFPGKDTRATLPQKFLSWGSLVGGVFFLAGFFTQVVAILLSAIAATQVFLEYKKDGETGRQISFYSLLFVVSFSFLFLGPGLWSIDYPL